MPAGIAFPRCRPASCRSTWQISKRPLVLHFRLAAKGGPPALPGRQPLFDISGGRLVPMWLRARKRAMDGRFGSESLKREDWDKGWLRSSSPSRKGPFEGPATAKPPALPGDAY